MTDKEVIKWFEFCRVEGDCSTDCPYWDNNGGVRGCTVQLAKDVLAMLKEQEAVVPTFKQDKDGIFVWACGSCGAYMYHIYDGIDKAKEYAKYCRQCGKKVKWD